MEKQIIYILTNEAMPGYVKIGKTTNNLQRIKDLSSSTSVPLPFICHHASIVKDNNFVEKQLHDAFDDSRINPKREFFIISPERVVSALRLAEIEDITPKDSEELIDSKEDKEALDFVISKRPRFSFKMVDIKPGEELVFSRDENIKAIVIDDRNIEFNGDLTSLSLSAQKILNYKKAPSGTEFWKYNDETLDERRIRIESEKNN